MVYWDEQGNTVEISKADQLWLDDGYFKTQQAHLPPDAPRAALSYRVSTKGQVDHNDIPMQKIKCRKFAQQQGWRVVMEKAEKGISGSKVSASKRDVIQELRQEAGNGSFDILVLALAANDTVEPPPAMVCAAARAFASPCAFAALFLRQVVFVADVADQFLGHVFQRDDAVGAAVFVDYHGQVNDNRIYVPSYLESCLHCFQRTYRDDRLLHSHVHQTLL